MDDRVVLLQEKQIQAIDKEIRTKEDQLARQEELNRKLMEMLVKSEPIDDIELGISTTSKSASNVSTGPFAFPTASRGAWIKCPIHVVDQWTCIFREKLVIGVELENIHSDKLVADIHGTILAIPDENQDCWLTNIRSCCVRFDSNGGLRMEETNCLRPRDKVFLVVSATAPANLLSSDLVLVAQAFVRDSPNAATTTDSKAVVLPPVLDPQRWHYWSGEVVRVSRNDFDPSEGGGAPIFHDLDRAFDGNGRTKLDVRKVLMSALVCQEQRRVRLQLIDPLTGREVFENPKLGLLNCSSSDPSAQYSKHPLFDGIIIFILDPSSSFAPPTSEFELLISGWSSEQIERFLFFLDSTINNATIEILDGGERNSTTKKKETSSDFLKIAKQLEALSKKEDADFGEMGNDRRTVNGDEYRELRLELTAMDVLRFL